MKSYLQIVNIPTIKLATPTKNPNTVKNILKTKVVRGMFLQLLFLNEIFIFNL